VFCTQSRIPENLGIVKTEDGASLLCFDKEVVVAGNNLEIEDAEFIVGVERVCFVDDGADGRVFVEDYLADDIFVGQVLVAKVYLG